MMLKKNVLILKAKQSQVTTPLALIGDTRVTVFQASFKMAIDEAVAQLFNNDNRCLT